MSSTSVAPPDRPQQVHPHRLSVASLCSPTSSQPRYPKSHDHFPATYSDPESNVHLDEDVLIAVKALGDMRSGSGVPPHHHSFDSSRKFFYLSFAIRIEGKVTYYAAFISAFDFNLHSTYPLSLDSNFFLPLHRL